MHLDRDDASSRRRNWSWVTNRRPERVSRRVGALPGPTAVQIEDQTGTPARTTLPRSSCASSPAPGRWCEPAGLHAQHSFGRRSTRLQPEPNQPGHSYTLTATDPTDGLTPATSNPFDVSEGVAAQLNSLLSLSTALVGPRSPRSATHHGVDRGRPGKRRGHRHQRRHPGHRHQCWWRHALRLYRDDVERHRHVLGLRDRQDRERVHPHCHRCGRQSHDSFGTESDVQYHAGPGRTGSGLRRHPVRRWRGTRSAPSLWSPSSMLAATPSRHRGARTRWAGDWRKPGGRHPLWLHRDDYRGRGQLHRLLHQ